MRLASRLPHPERRLAQLDELRKTMEQMRPREDDLLVRIFHLNGPGSDSFDIDHKLYQDEKSVETSYLTSTGDVVKEAQSSWEWADARYKAYTWLSYGLYTIGWLLSFAGKIAGVEGIQAAG